MTISVSIKRLVLDSLKPRETSIIDLSKAICKVEGVEEVDITVTEVDARTETIKLTVRGTNVNYEKLSETLNHYGATIRSIDEINVGKLKT